MKKQHSIRMKAATNLVLGVLVFSVGALCISPIHENVAAEVQGNEIYRFAENGKGVSLMFNVYMGTEYVYRILEILSENEAKATFFIGGCWADDNVDCLRTIYEQGHEIGNHGYFHKAQETLGLDGNKREIEDCNRFVELAIGISPTLFAPPSGAYNDATLEAVGMLNMKTILWSKDTIDWRDKNAALIYSRATKNVKVGDFILMHPTEKTAEALGDILKYYKKNSLTAVTVSENLQLEG